MRVNEWRRDAAGELRGNWRALVGGTLGVAVGAAALPFYTAGLFVEPLQHEFGWTRSAISAVSFATTLTMVLCSPIAGFVIDRYGVRFPAALSLLALAGGFALLGASDAHIWRFALIQVALCALGIASTPISFTRAINERFSRARGLALGVTLSGTGLAATLAPPTVAAIIVAHGWRSAYHVLAAIVLLCVLPVFLLLKPKIASVSGTPIAPRPGADAPAKRVALSDPRMIRLSAAFFLLALGVSGFVLHLIPMLQDVGMNSAEAAAIQARLGIAVIIGRVLIGFLIDHFFAPRVAALSLCGTVAGLASLAIWGTTAAPWSAFAIGFALGAEVDLIGYLTARYFGLASYGRVYGLLYGAFILGAGLSPLLIASIAESFGNYQPALWLCTALVGLVVFLLASAPRFEICKRDELVTSASICAKQAP